MTTVIPLKGKKPSAGFALPLNGYWGSCRSSMKTEASGLARSMGYFLAGTCFPMR